MDFIAIHRQPSMLNIWLQFKSRLLTVCALGVTSDGSKQVWGRYAIIQRFAGPTKLISKPIVGGLHRTHVRVAA